MKKHQMSVTSDSTPDAALVHARQRIGETAISQLGWLTWLANQSDDDLRAYLSGVPMYSLFPEIVCFTSGTGGDWHPAAAASFRAPTTSTESLIEAFRLVRHGLEQLADHGRTDWPDLAPRTRYFEKRPEGVTAGGAAIQGRLTVQYEDDDIAAAFASRAADVVAAEGGRLARCDALECRRLLVRRKRGLFCNNRCALKERQRVWRQRHSKETEGKANG
jgi:hypothetical protein